MTALLSEAVRVTKVFVYRSLLVTGYAAKPSHFPHFWPLRADPGSAEAMAKLKPFLDWLAKHSSSCGGHARMALVKAAHDGAPDLGLVTGSGKPGECVGILFCRHSASE